MPLDAVTRELQSVGKGIVADRATTIRRTWLDTFDWRLFRAGDALIEESTGKGRTSLVLRSLGGDRPERRVPSAERPTTVETLPVGLHGRLADLLTPRALAVVGSERVHTRRLRQVDADGKTVAQIVVEALDADDRVRVELVPMLGYPAAEVIARTLDANADLARIEDPLHQAAARQGLTPGELAGDLDEVTLRADEPAPVAVAELLAHLRDAMASNRVGLRKKLDTEFLHDFRVALRRSRSVLQLSRTLFDPALVERWQTELSWIADISSAPRDLDVFALEVASYRTLLPDDAETGLSEVAAALAVRCGAAHAALDKALLSRRYTDLERGWRAAIAGMGENPAPDAPPALAFARRVIARAHRRVLKHGAAITPDSPPTALHDLRKDAKRLRYALEVFASVFPDEQIRPLVRELKKVQDVLGDYQDRQVHRLLLIDVAAEMAAADPPAPSGVLSASRLSARLELQESEARARYASCFERFSSKGNRRRFEQLVSD